MLTKECLMRMIDVAEGRKPADLVIKGGRIIDVCSGEIYEADVAVANGYIAGIGQYEGVQTVDVGGRFVAPGLIDAHIHIESSYCSPEEFGRMVVPHGTTTVIADPHEIVNVCGLEGFRYMKEAAAHTALDVKLMMPSCVPATELEDAGAVILAADMEADMNDAAVPGLGELMDYVAVKNNHPVAIDKIMLAKRLGKVIDGHSPNVFDHDLDAYTCAGIRTDHECSTAEEMRERLRRGVYVQLRQGSACHNLAALAPAVTPFNFRRCLVCSDDRQPKTIFEEGHLEYHLKMLTAAGIDPVMAVTMATCNAADCYGLDDRGMIAPGRRADLTIFEDLTDFRVHSVYILGEQVAADGAYLKEVTKTSIQAVSSSVHVKDFSIDRLRMKLTDNRVHAIEMIPGEVLSKKAVVPVCLDKEGDFSFDPALDVVKCAVIERHKETGKIGLGFIKGYGMTCGAVAASVAHDSHNIICVGVSNEEMAVAIQAMIDQEGGFVVVKNGEVIESLPLPIAGLMSDQSGAWVADKLSALHRTAVRELGVHPELEPIMTLTFMSLIVIPEMKITARGMFDVGKYEFVSIEADS
ncbi:MAG: adenine deaminase [Lachnospiraceae bacterium]|nr:adenine deaminase [Lachnospiraceae bacterium]MDY5741661.1 adenine deaminase [Lachnospiraceae bacterium]